MNTRKQFNSKEMETIVSWLFLQENDITALLTPSVLNNPRKFAAAQHERTGVSTLRMAASDQLDEALRREKEQNR